MTEQFTKHVSCWGLDYITRKTFHADESYFALRTDKLGRVGTYGKKVHIGKPKYSEKIMMWAVVCGEGINYAKYFKNFRLTAHDYIGTVSA